MSQFAVVMACQTPFKFGLPSGIRGPLATAFTGAACARASSGVISKDMQTTAANIVDRRARDVRIEKVNATNNPEQCQSNGSWSRLSACNGCFSNGTPLPRPPDRQPKARPQFADDAGDATGNTDNTAEDGVFIVRVEHGSSEAEHIEDAAQHQHDVQHPRCEARSEHQPSQRDKPQSREDVRHQEQIVGAVQRLHDLDLQLIHTEGGRAFGPIQQRKNVDLSSHGGQRKRYTYGHEGQQETGGAFTYRAEQLVEDQAE